MSLINSFMYSHKRLYLGNDTIDTDIQVTEAATQLDTKNFGLLTDPTFIPTDPGLYHTTIIDMALGDIVSLATYFDSIHLLDQDESTWSHWKILLSTIKLMHRLAAAGHQVEYLKNQNVQRLLYWENLLRENKSICAHPWTLLQADRGHSTLCARDKVKISDNPTAQGWQTNPDYQEVREKMMAGELLPDHCVKCYEFEDKGIESPRIFETMEWVSRLGLKTVNDFTKLEYPCYYEIRPSNLCNLACRSCKPDLSSLVATEYKKMQVTHPAEQHYVYSNFDIIDQSTLDDDIRVYVAGGEPTFNDQLFKFMEKCIATKKTDFELTIGTNGYKFSSRFLSLADHFSNLHFSFSIDAYGKINDYMRWPSKFDAIVKNAHNVINRGHKLTFNCVPSIFNVTNLHLLYEFLSEEFPFNGIYVQLNAYPEKIQSAFNHPNAELARESLMRCTKTLLYHADSRANRSSIDGLLANYSDPNFKCDLVALNKFFALNDKMDQSRGMKLAEYIPELEECRKYIAP